ncbi:MAG: GNAT family N-acetyltransferase [Bacteroidota bacterium]
MEFREATLDQEDECLRMMEDFYKMNGYTYYETDASRNFEEFIQNENLGKFWVITQSGKTIGYVILTFGYSFEYGGRDAFVDELYLKAEYRNRGIGTLILESIDFYAHKHGVKAIHLEVEQDNEAGNRLYIKSGFKSNDRALLSKTVE